MITILFCSLLFTVGSILLVIGTLLLLRLLPEYYRQGIENEFIKSKNTILLVIKHLFVSGSLIMLLVVLLFGLDNYSDKIARSNLKLLGNVDTISVVSDTNRTSEWTITSNDTPRIQRLKTQLLSVNNLRKFHLGMSTYFFKQYFFSITIASIFGIIAAIALFLIVRTGIDNASNYIINIFFTSVSISSLFYSFPLIYKQEENLNQNTALYIYYANLKNEIISYSVISPKIKPNENSIGRNSLSLNQFIHYIDSVSAQKLNIPLSFDMSKVKDYKKRLEEINPEKE